MDVYNNIFVRDQTPGKSPVQNFYFSLQHKFEKLGDSASDRTQIPNCDGSL